MSANLLHYLLLIVFILASFYLYYKILICDEVKRKIKLTNNILDKNIRYVWVNGLMARVEAIISEHVISVSLLGEDGDTPPFYCNLSTVKLEVIEEDLLACGIISKKSEVEVKASDSLKDSSELQLKD